VLGGILMVTALYVLINKIRKNPAVQRTSPR